MARQTTSKIDWMKPILRGKTFVLTKLAPFTEEAHTKPIKAEGGKIVNKVSAALTFLVIGGDRKGGQSPAEKEARKLIKDGAGIRILNDQEFYDLFKPGREETLAMWSAGARALERWSQLSQHWARKDAVEPIDLRGLDLRRCKLHGMDLLNGLMLDQADFREADLSGAFLPALRGVKFDGACLAGSNLDNLVECSLVGANLTDANGLDVSIAGSNFQGATLVDIGIRANAASGAVMKNANLERANWNGSKLVEVDFSNANLSAAQLIRCDLTGSSLAKARLTGAFLTSSKLANANLRGADLTDAQLNQTDLRGADLTSANLERAYLYGAKYDNRTRFPKGFTPVKGMKRTRGGLGGDLDGKAVKGSLAEFYQKLQKSTDVAKLAKALAMLKADRFKLYAQVADDHLTGVVKSQTDTELVYSCRLNADGSYACCTQNLNICGGLRGSLCKHLLVLIVGLSKSNELDPTIIDQWVENSKGQKPALDKDVMSETFIRYKGAEAGEIDWRPTETIPEDYYAL